MSIAIIPHALPTGGTMFRNVIINGGFNVNLRGASSNMTAMCTTAVTSPTPSPYFVADRWIAYRAGLVANGQMALMTLSPGDIPFTSVGLTNFARIGRANGDTSLGVINLVTNLESMNSIPLAAKTVTLSFYCRAGANYSGSTNGINALAIGVLVDQNYVINGLGAGATILSNSFAATTSWQRFSYSYNVPANATQVAPTIGYTPSGTAGAADYIDVTGVQLEIASSPTSFELRPYAVESPLCQRYYEITIESSIGTQTLMINNTFPAGIGNFSPIFFKITKRVVPSLSGTLYAPGGGATATTSTGPITGLNCIALPYSYSQSGSGYFYLYSGIAAIAEL